MTTSATVKVKKGISSQDWKLSNQGKPIRDKTGAKQDTHTRDTRGKRELNLRAIEKWLAERGIKTERVLGYVCFTYEKLDYRARDVLDAKKALGLEGF